MIHYKMTMECVRTLDSAQGFFILLCRILNMTDAFQRKDMWLEETRGHPSIVYPFFVFFFFSRLQEAGAYSCIGQQAAGGRSEQKTSPSQSQVF